MSCAKYPFLGDQSNTAKGVLFPRLRRSGGKCRLDRTMTLVVGNGCRGSRSQVQGRPESEKSARNDHIGARSGQYFRLCPRRSTSPFVRYAATIRACSTTPRSTSVAPCPSHCGARPTRATASWREEERGVGKGRVRQVRSRGAPDHTTNNKISQKC